MEDHMVHDARMKAAALAAAVTLFAGAAIGAAEQVKLTDGTEFTGQVVQRTPESLVILVPRKAVASIDGKAMSAPVVEGMPAPDFTATDMNGAAHSLSANRGSVTLVQFWASWCPYCRKDLSLVKQLAQQYEGKELKLVTVSIDEDMDKLKALMQAESIAYPVIVGTEAGRISALYEASGVPAYFLVGKDGKLAGVWRGSVTATSGAGKTTELEEKLAALLPAGA
jgi:thiol-disulfide isomerase/thioredoxin